MAASGRRGVTASGAGGCKKGLPTGVTPRRRVLRVLKVKSGTTLLSRFWELGSVSSPIDFSAKTDGDYFDGPRLIIYGKDDSVISDSHAIFLPTGQLFAALGSRIVFQRKNSR